MTFAGCQGPEGFSRRLAGNIFGSQGSGGSVGGTGGDVMTGPGTGGAPGTGGDTTSGTGGAPDLDAGPSDVGAPPDLPPAPDALPDLRREVRMPEPPFTPIDCLTLKPYKADDQSYGPNTQIYSLRDLRVFRCMDFPQSGWCTIGAYEPELEVGYWKDCWVPIGYCQ